MLTRAKPVAFPKNVPLIIIAGLPKRVDSIVVARMKKRWPVARYIAVPFSRAYEINPVRTLLKASADFVLRRRSRVPQRDPVVPSQIFLLYIRSDNDERLLAAFDFFCFPVALPPSPGNGWRTNSDKASSAVSEAIAAIRKSAPEYELLKMEILQRRGKSALLLPPANFIVDSNRTPIAGEFRRLRRNFGDINSVVQMVQPRKFLREELPQVLGASSKGYFFEDVRKLVFPPPNVGEYHGLPRELPEGASDAEIRLKLNELYRFGLPIDRGFHHDAQRVGVVLRSEEFRCGRLGPVSVSGSHARIYPNDYISAKKVEVIKTKHG